MSLSPSRSFTPGQMILSLVIGMVEMVVGVGIGFYLDEPEEPDPIYFNQGPGEGPLRLCPGSDRDIYVTHLVNCDNWP